MSDATYLLRREFLLSIAAGAAWAAPAPKPRAGCQTNAWPIAGLPQFLDVLGRIRKLGYAGFETSFRNLQAHFDRAPEVKARIAATGLRFLGIHIFLTEYDARTGVAPRELIEKVAAGGAALGAERLILSGQGLGAQGRPDAEAVKRKAGALSAAAEHCRGMGLTLAYHNHNVEFLHGGAEIDGLLERTAPRAVRLIFDAGHAYVGGAKVVPFFERHHARIDGMHLRDFRAGQQVPLGQGEFDLRPLAAAARRALWSGWVINEEERPNDVRPGEAVVAPARRHMREVFGV
jgi:sugar phosphate isomerase/epimerase